MVDRLAEVLFAAAYGFGSALIPVLNAEIVLYVRVMSSSVLFASFFAISLATGQTAGKLLLFELARKGRAFRRSATTSTSAGAKEQGLESRIVRALRNRSSAAALVTCSAFVGLPPLALTSVVYGAANSRRDDFVVCCLLGRSVRFLLLALTANLGIWLWT